MLKFILAVIFFNPVVSARPKAGGYSTANATSPQVISASQYAIQIMNQNCTAYDKQLNMTGHLLLSRVISAKSQVVAGVNYKIQLQVSDTLNKTIGICIVVYQGLPWMIPL
ncbi:hypothetical protein CEUSTIGMA_g13814.t1 [Chlamydomonas eustigma]|uniref:Cystatin domain-containing protein n=1 Tax=Chlamydomonas eustigma TaxID=1157962 RepID=A0A250XTM6_9CHLO|nr:hypothetical protein CEUSTIGMA_g13814.t1 [Chlamydomonas eustigma]|eukprot:GAX86404.1 hypothetical protein CEUSTIGMA_g13814.t1 [Chlamydomonas eustigma]